MDALFRFSLGRKAVNNRYINWVGLNDIYLCSLKLILIWVEFSQDQDSFWDIPLLLMGTQYKITDVAKVINL